MPFNDHILTLLINDHPHSKTVLTAFAPLLRAQMVLAEKLPPLELPELNKNTFHQGKAWLPATEKPTVYCKQDSISAIIPPLVQAALEGFSTQHKEDIFILSQYLEEHPEEACALLHEYTTTRNVTAWAKKHQQNETVTTLLASCCASVFGRRVARSAPLEELSEWTQGHCPICGSQPHASSIRTKEGQRFLQCSFCFHEWRYSRSACPVCKQEDLKNLPVFFLENKHHERAEGCSICKHYLLGVDMRALADKIPLELYVLCLLPLDLLMQEKDYLPAMMAQAV